MMIIIIIINISGVFACTHTFIGWSNNNVNKLRFICSLETN